MEFQFLPAVIAGLIMEMPVYLQKALGLDVKQDIFRTWGAMLSWMGRRCTSSGSCSTRSSPQPSR